jgi:hypothetical protein
MSVNTDNRKRWLPRFSIRTLIGIVTLICLFFGSWELTKTIGVPAVAKRLEAMSISFFGLTSQGPFLVSAYENQRPLGAYQQPAPRRHHLWLVVASVRLPEQFTSFVERVEDKWYAWTNDGHMRPQRVHGGII